MIGLHRRRALKPAEFDAIVALPCTAVGVRVSAGALTSIAFLPVATPAQPGVDPLARQAAAQILEYAEDSAYRLELPMSLAGTEFQRRVWAALLTIQSGRTRTYGDLAAELGSTARAIGQACGDNPLPLWIPCHRVVSARGLGGFAHHAAGSTVDIKRWLVAHESRPVFALT